MRISDWSSDVCSSDLSRRRCQEGYRRYENFVAGADASPDKRKEKCIGPGAHRDRLLSARNLCYALFERGYKGPLKHLPRSQHCARPIQHVIRQLKIVAGASEEFDGAHLKLR